MGPVSLHCAEILLYLKISIRWGSVSVRCASLVLRRKYKVHEVGFVTAATGLLHLHYDSKNTHTRAHTKSAPPFQMPKPFQVTTEVHLMLLQCSLSSVAIEFVPLKRIWNLNSAGLCWAAVIGTTATITLRVNLFKWYWLTVITMPNVAAHFHGLFSFNSHLSVSLLSCIVCQPPPQSQSRRGKRPTASIYTVLYNKKNHSKVNK